ncbi:MAG: hypothetical protein J7M05_13665, partial [Anaerolineae bacterium]|nr:hypothetical protein [Anaerolineae bacterium]
MSVRNKKIFVIFLTLVISILISSCSLPSLTSLRRTRQEKKLTMYVAYGHPERIAEAFEEATGIKIEFLTMSSGEVLTRLRAEKTNPQTDVWLGRRGASPTTSITSCNSLVLGRSKPYFQHNHLCSELLGTPGCIHPEPGHPACPYPGAHTRAFHLQAKHPQFLPPGLFYQYRCQHARVTNSSTTLPFLSPRKRLDRRSSHPPLCYSRHFYRGGLRHSLQ